MPVLKLPPTEIQSEIIWLHSLIVQQYEINLLSPPLGVVKARADEDARDDLVADRFISKEPAGFFT